MPCAIHGLQLLVCIGCVASFRKGGSPKPFNISMFSWPAASDRRWSHANTSDCQLARQVVVLAQKVEGNSSMRFKALEEIECARCRAGYIELPHLVTIQMDDFTWQGYLQTCYFKPCGEACQDCWENPLSFRRVLGKAPKTEYSCRKCQPTSLSHTVLVNMQQNQSIITATGGKLRIKTQCLAVSSFREGQTDEDSLSAEDTLFPIVSRLIRPPSGQLSRAEENPFELISLIETFVVHATQEFQSTSGGNLVGEGAEFLAGLVQKVLKKFTAADKDKMGKTLSTSSVIADTRGALTLCRDKAMVKIGSTLSPVDDARWEASLKLCTGIELVLSQLRQYTAGNHDLGRQSTLFSDDQRSIPRRALAMLFMFDGILG